MTDTLPPPHVVDIAPCTGEVYDHGAQVVRWAPRGADPVLYVSSEVVLRVGQAVRAGIPVCWPWFGPGRSPGMEPSHGFARTTTWELVERIDEERSVTFVHRLADHDATSPHWPHRYAVELRSRLGADLEVSLTTTNTGAEPFDYEEALHAYLVVGDIDQVSLDGLVGASFFDKVFGARRQQTGRVRITGETDAVYRTDGPVVVDDPVLERSLEVSTRGMADMVVWNPWKRKAREAADIGDDDWRHFLCVEGANVLDDAVALGAGQSHTSTYLLSVKGR
ncbi:MAG: D-hexose-6-phosphate mutarotase [Ornithinibacter sp.]